MTNLIPTVLVLACGAAISPTVLTAVILTLSSKQNVLRRGLAFLLGCIIPLIVWCLLILAFTQQPKVQDPSTRISAYIDTLLGLMLILYAVWKVFRKSKNQELIHDVKQHEASQQNSGVRKSLVFGMVMMSLNLSTLALFVPAIKDTFLSDLQMLSKVLLTIVVFIITLLPVELPLLLYCVFPDTAAKTLLPLSDWTNSHRRGITIGVCLVFGIFLFHRGISS